MRYKCQFPNCNYTTDQRTQIHNHHIVPKKLNGSNKSKNRIYLCPTHHTKIFQPSVKRGIHSKKSEDSLILLGWISGTNGTNLHYTDLDGNEYFSKRQ